MARVSNRDPNGREYDHCEIIGGSDEHWLVQYTYRIPGGVETKSFWEKM